MQVEIFDQAHSLFGSDPEHIRELAKLDDSSIRAIAVETHRADTEQLAVLVALRFAAEYDLLKKAGYRCLRFFHVEPQLGVERVGGNDARRQKRRKRLARGAVRPATISETIHRRRQAACP